MSNSSSAFATDFNANTKAIPLGTAKHLTKELMSIQENIADIKATVTDGHFKDPNLLGELETLKLKEQTLTKCLEGQVVHIKDQNEVCCLGNGVKMLINGKQKMLYLDHVPTKAAGTISINSNLGRKIWGRKAGDSGIFINENASKPTEQKWEILEIFSHTKAKKLFFRKEEEINLQVVN